MDGHLHLNAACFWVEVVDETRRPVAPATEGQIVVTDLRNRAAPIIRYAVGDTGSLAAEPRAVGIALPASAGLSWRPPSTRSGSRGAPCCPPRAVSGLRWRGNPWRPCAGPTWWSVRRRVHLWGARPALHLASLAGALPAGLGSPARSAVLHGQTIGPFSGPLQTWLARGVLDHASVILTREGHSAAALRAVGFRAPVKVVPDPAFGLVPGVAHARVAEELLRRHGIPRGVPLVGVTVRQWRGERGYLTSLAVAIQALVSASGAHVIIWPQSTGPGEYDDDRPSGRVLLAAVSAKGLAAGQGMERPGSVTLVEEEIPAAALKAAYARMDLMVATRYHSAVFVVAEGVPTLAVSCLGSKAPGVMEELGLGEWALICGTFRPDAWRPSSWPSGSAVRMSADTSGPASRISWPGRGVSLVAGNLRPEIPRPAGASQSRTDPSPQGGSASFQVRFLQEMVRSGQGEKPARDGNRGSE